MKNVLRTSGRICLNVFFLLLCNALSPDPHHQAEPGQLLNLYGDSDCVCLDQASSPRAPADVRVVWGRWCHVYHKRTVMLCWDATLWNGLSIVLRPPAEGQAPWSRTTVYVRRRAQLPHAVQSRADLEAVGPHLWRLCKHRSCVLYIYRLFKRKAHCVHGGRDAAPSPGHGFLHPKLEVPPLTRGWWGFLPIRSLLETSVGWFKSTHDVNISFKHRYSL